VDLRAARRHLLVALLALLVAIGSAVLSRPQLADAAAPAPPAPAAAPPTLPPPGTPGLVPPLGPRAWVVVDADTGNVVDASDDHTPMRPASISKVLTAIVAAQHVPPNAVVPVSPVAAGTESVNLGMKTGQVWSFIDTLHAMLMLSANDAATALAERVSGSREAFVGEMARAAASLHLVDHPVLRDPAGLDDQFSRGGTSFPPTTWPSSPGRPWRSPRSARSWTCPSTGSRRPTGWSM
jgi:D-alanyl-D-alanine carboxypeptidase